MDIRSQWVSIVVDSRYPVEIPSLADAALADCLQHRVDWLFAKKRVAHRGTSGFDSSALHCPIVNRLGSSFTKPSLFKFVKSGDRSTQIHFCKQGAIDPVLGQLKELVSNRRVLGPVGQLGDLQSRFI